MTQNDKTRSGFTLVEALTTVTIFTLISYGLIALVSNIFTFSSGQTNLLAGADQARKTAFIFGSELRRATNGVDGAYPLGLASDQEIIFYANADNLPDIERIRYFFTNGELFKGITKPSGSIYNLASESVNTAADSLVNNTDPIFYYYGGDFDGTDDTFLTQPVNLNSVKFVRMELRILKTGGLVNTQSYQVSSGAAIRNLKTNLDD